MIPDEIVERVKDAADIVQIIGEYVPLRKMGADFRGPCPFHQGKHRNFSVSGTRNMYYCFVCHEAGDVFSFLRKRLGLEWPEAVRMVAGRYGIDVPESSGRREGPDPREPVWELNATAGEYFSRMLWDDDAGRDARQYLEKRNIDRVAAERFSLGFAPRDPGLFRAHMSALGFDEQRLLDAGLLVRRDESGEVRPRFFGRLIFPIHDLSGHVVGFGGRMLGAGEPKYLNSSDSQVFSKGKLLYALNQARATARKEERIIVVEGYFDVIRVMLSGIENVVAPLGTALTEEQAALLARYAREVVLLYDSDAAGLKATFRAGDMLLAQGASVLVATLPPGDDPDSYAERTGREGLAELLAGAIDVFERKIRVLEQKGWFRDITHRRRAIDRLLPTIRATKDPLMRDLYASRASEAAGLSKDTIMREADEKPGRIPRAASRNERVVPRAVQDERQPADAAPAGQLRGASPNRPRLVRGESAERAILAALVQVPGKLETVAERIGPADFWVPEHRMIFELMIESGGDIAPAELGQKLAADAVPCLQRIIQEGSTITDIGRTLDDSIARMESRALARQRKAIDRQMRVANEEEQVALLRQKWELNEHVLSMSGRPVNKQPPAINDQRSTDQGD